MYSSNATPLNKTQLIWEYDIIKKKKKSLIRLTITSEIIYIEKDVN